MKTKKVWVSRDDDPDKGASLWLRCPTKTSFGWSDIKAFVGLRPGECKEFRLVPVSKKKGGLK